ncbi:MAG TPA: glycoside hydrolase domain-containing protein [Dinghuibacter sp.]|uniref:glycoside hydrolase domain-containing protein n=1 Tax=Dinghuibacter sp. TaxID=2024697 RepID=UPI002C824242|nr:glycoside hydrolase domain-containing protein [Dinghuibacter sp.]HTJ12828.1 glycoside hydrolase domain-containing protein [Dinghuibacter sp.]
MKVWLLLLLLGAAGTAAAQVLPYGDGHNAWNPDSLGDIRAVVSCAGGGDAVLAHIPWRRRDERPEMKRVIVQEAETGRKVQEVYVGNITREAGDIYFKGHSGKYYVYYMPYRNEGRSNYPKGVYLKPDSSAWRPGANPVTATADSIEYINAFNSFYPMEVIATRAETEAVVKGHTDFIVFPEDRSYPIRMERDLPYRWVARGLADTVSLSDAEKGENYAFQLGIYALKELKHVRVGFADWQGDSGQVIPGGRFFCVNTQGMTYDAKPFEPVVDVPAGNVQPLWCSVSIPGDAKPGIYKGVVTVQAEGAAPKMIHLAVTVSDKIAVNGGVNEPAKMTRLSWLNSTMAQENTVIAPYTPLEVVGDSLVRLLGRDISIGKDGLPAQIRTFFTPEMTSIGTTPHPLLTEPIHFHLNPAAQGELKMIPGGARFIETEPGTVTWVATSTSAAMQMDVHGSLEFDGFLAYTVRLIALEDIDLKETRWHMPLEPDAAKYLIGLNRKGGYRPDSIAWKWDVAHKNQDGAWVGGVNEGVQFSLRDQHYMRPLNTNFYLQKPLVLPESWGNGGKGGIDIWQKGKAILVNAYTGPRTMHKGDTLYYDFNLLITPFHPLNTDFQWANRFYHKYNELDSIHSTGATVVNIHHATPINPWINYPFIEWRRMKGYIDTAHSMGIKVKIYNTIRELSDHAYELPVLRSLGHEVYSPGKGGGFAWLQEHVGDDYIAAWFVPEIKDAAIINSGMNRWHNYYVEGMNWLVQHVGIDGIYLDDVAFDRVTMKRIKRVLTQDGRPGIIDLHSANQYDAADGWNNSANLYMEHFPYLNRLWFGEYFDYEHNSPDFFLTEVSGIPFGLMGEMLQGGGNPWRGMVYGMTNRLGWTSVNDPRPLWGIWDAFGMKGSEMIGYWSGHCPVSTGREDVLATVFKKPGKTLVALASWATADTAVMLNIDWRALGINVKKARLLAPAITGFQVGREFKPGRAIPVAKDKGLLLIIDESKDD